MKKIFKCVRTALHTAASLSLVAVAALAINGQIQSMYDTKIIKFSEPNRENRSAAVALARHCIGVRGAVTSITENMGDIERVKCELRVKK